METKTNHKTKPARDHRLLVVAALGLVSFIASLAGVLGSCDNEPRQIVAAPAAIEPAAPAVPTVTIIDQTGDRWPELRRAVRAWNRSPRVNITYGNEPVTGTYTVYVQANDYGARWLGLTNYLAPDTALIQLDMDPAHGRYLDRFHKTATAAHEVGHILGIQHPGEDAPEGIKGVIAGTPNGPEAELPTGADYAELREASVTAEHAGVFQYTAHYMEK